jgi:hypothetical protein
MARERWLKPVVIVLAVGVGVIAGAMGARAAATYNTEGWIGGKDLLSRPDSFQSGYVAGMADSVSHAAFNVSQDVNWAQRAKCLDRHSGLTAGRSGHLSTLVGWAKGILRARPSDASRYHAAAILIINACR